MLLGHFPLSDSKIKGLGSCHNTKSSTSEPQFATCYFQSSGTDLVWLPHIVGRMQQSIKTPLRKRAPVLSWNESVCSLPSNPVELVVAEGNQHSPGMVTVTVTPPICGGSPSLLSVGAQTKYLCFVCGSWWQPKGCGDPQLS